MNVNRRIELMIKLAKKKANTANEPFDKNNSTRPAAGVNLSKPDNETWTIVSSNEPKNETALHRSIEEPNSSTKILENKKEEGQLSCAESDVPQPSTSNVQLSDNLSTNCAICADSFDADNPDPDDPLWRGGLPNSITSDDKSISENADDSDRDPWYDPEDDGRNKISKLYKRRKVGNIEQSVTLMETSSEDTETEERSENVNIDFLNSPPAKKKRGRKRSLKKEEWIKNKSKKLKNSGQSYVSCSKSKKKFPEKALKPPCNDNCRLKCSTVISQEERQEIFNNFWKLGDLGRQRDFIAHHMQIINPEYRYVKQDSTRRLNNAFHFDVNNKRIRVCKTFFKNTIDITDRPIRTILEKKGKEGFVTEENRGKHKNHKKIDDAIKEDIRKHIESIPKIESHYIRKNSTRDYIEGDKTIADLHRDYVQLCKSPEDGNVRPYGNYIMYRKIFTEEYNISLFTPRKDQCELCHSYQTAEGNEKEQLKVAYENHIIEKDLSRLQKETDKNKVSPTTIVACYDLQAVLPCPKGEVSSMYYKSKLSVYNLTVCELKNDSTYCYVWHEGEGGRGSSEISSCVLDFIQKKCQNNVDDIEFIFYSDNCGGQQKNKYLFSMYLYAIENFPIKSITHNFLIRGHSQNEGDSVHSTIEKQIRRSLKSGPIYHPGHYISLIRTAKKNGNPYNVIEKCHSDFYDFKDLWEKIGCNATYVTEGNKLAMTDIKIVRVEKTKPLTLQYKTSFAEEEKYQSVPIQEKFGEEEEESGSGKRRSARNMQGKKLLPTCNGVSLKQMYEKRLSIPEKKKKDLQYLLNNKIIPGSYALFYDSL